MKTDWFKPLRFVKKETGLSNTQIATIRKKIRLQNTYKFECHIKEIKGILAEIDQSGMTIKQKVELIVNLLK